MPIIITFHKVSEEKPEHGQSIIWLKNTTSFGYQSFDPREIRAEYVWDDDNGTTACFHPDTEDFNVEEFVDSEEGIVWKLRLMFDGWFVEDSDDLWIDVEEYWKCFEEVV